MIRGAATVGLGLTLASNEPVSQNDHSAPRPIEGSPDTVLRVNELRGRVAIVTGAAGGIGLAASEAFVAERMIVVMADINEEKVRQQASRLRDQGSVVVPIAVDVSDPDSVDHVAQAAVDQFGALHVAVNNAGIVNRGYSWELSLQDWHRVLDVDLWGVIHGIRSFVPHILASRDEGHVVNVASMAAVLPVERLGPYTVAKHGVLGLSDVLRSELREIDAPVGVSVVMPGLIRTGMNPVGTVEPSTVALNIVDAIRHGRDYVFTDDHFAEEVGGRLRAILASQSDVRS
jgi:NAD(P)-dependent dehydrogenase (short-subunit alcohol dehydrogenase family)